MVHPSNSCLNITQALLWLQQETKLTSDQPWSEARETVGQFIFWERRWVKTAVSTETVPAFGLAGTSIIRGQKAEGRKMKQTPNSL